MNKTSVHCVKLAIKQQKQKDKKNYVQFQQP